VSDTRTSDVQYDPYNVEIYADPYPAFRRLRAEAPIYHNGQYDFYAVSRYEDVERGLIDSETYISRRGVILEMIKANIEMPPGTLIMEDAPVHTVRRTLLSRVFTPRKMAALEPKIREFCARSLDPLIGAGRFDFVADLGAQMPMRIIGMLLGIPEDDQEAIRDLDDAALRTEAGKPMRYSQLRLSGEVFADYIDWRAQHPSDDLMTELLQAEFKDETGTVRRLTRNEVLTYVNVIAGAGNETTNRLIGWIAKGWPTTRTSGVSWSRTARSSRTPSRRSSATSRPRSGWPGTWRATSSSTAGRYRRAAPCCSWLGPPTTTTVVSRAVTSSTSTGRSFSTSPSATAPTSASARRWPAWRAGWRSTRF
jgi:alkylated DNA nucleotide flippase Atl1